MTPTTQLPGESDRAYSAFKCYADMGDKRSQHAVGRELAKSRQIISRWSARWHWKERIAAMRVTEHDQQLDANAQAKLEAARAKEALALRVQARAAATFERMSEKADRFLSQPEDLEHAKDTKGRSVRRGGPSAANAAVRLVLAADQIGRLAAGLPTSNSVMTGKDGAPLGAMQPIVHNIVVSPESDKLREIRKRFGVRPAQK